MKNSDTSPDNKKLLNANNRRILIVSELHAYHILRQKNYYDPTLTIKEEIVLVPDEKKYHLQHICVG